MTLLDIIFRSMPPMNSEGAKIPWNEPEFSKRMLENHLTDAHDWASRRAEIIDRQVAFIAEKTALGARVLDIGCGPGLYLERLARRGYACSGVDFSPASIEYARSRAESEGLDIGYELADVREYEPKGAYSAVLLLFGEINVFSRADAEKILDKAAAALEPGGLLFLETHSYDEVKRQGLVAQSWASYPSGLFSTRPHLCLSENFWDEENSVATVRYLIVEAESAECAEYLSSMSGYTDEEYRDLLKSAGFEVVDNPSGDAWPVGCEFSGKLLASVYEKL